MGGQLGKERAAIWQRVFDNPATPSALGCVSS